MTRLRVAEVEQAIGVPAQDWKGRCFEIASLLVKTGLVKGHVVYGHWIGPIARSSVFADRAHLGFCNHGWVLLDDGETVIDPTRWVFEDKDPYIFKGSAADGVECIDFCSEDTLDPVCRTCGHLEEEHEKGFFSPCKLCRWPYDEGGNRLREKTRRDAPEAGDDEKKFAVLKHLSKADLAFVRRLFGKVRPGVKLTWRQAHWLATLPYDEYEGCAHAIYTALQKAGAVGLVPVDNERRAKREGS